MINWQFYECDVVLWEMYEFLWSWWCTKIRNLGLFRASKDQTEKGRNTYIKCLSTGSFNTPWRKYSFSLEIKLKFIETFFFAEIPNFTGPILNVTVPLGREAMLECNIDNLSAYKVSICNFYLKTRQRVKIAEILVLFPSGNFTICSKNRHRPWLLKNGRAWRKKFFFSSSKATFKLVHGKN